MTENLKKWQDRLVVLPDLPEEKLIKFGDSMEFTMNFLLENNEGSDVNYFLHLNDVPIEDYNVDLLFLPIMLRILLVVDMTEDDIVELYHTMECNFDDEMKEILSAPSEMAVDYTGMYCKMVADNVIEHVQKTK